MKKPDPELELLSGLAFKEDLKGKFSDWEISQIHLSNYRKATDQEKERIIASLSNWAHTRQWAWDTLTEIVSLEEKPPGILKDCFILPVIKGERNPPGGKRGRPRKDKENWLIVAAVRVLMKDYGFSKAEAINHVAGHWKLEEGVRKTLRRMESETPFKRGGQK